jgi:hypothetical protein
MPNWNTALGRVKPGQIVEVWHPYDEGVCLYLVVWRGQIRVRAVPLDSSHPSVSGVVELFPVPKDMLREWKMKIRRVA